MQVQHRHLRRRLNNRLPNQNRRVLRGCTWGVSHACEGQTYAITLGWSDAADNEDGYRIYRNNALFSSLGAGAEGYADNPPQGGPYTYRVEAFNAQGTSSATTEGEGCLL